jgi:hypothetical protein
LYSLAKSAKSKKGFWNRGSTKYGNQKTLVDGRYFSSRGEAGCYEYLKTLAAMGHITIISFQKKIISTFNSKYN